MTTTQARTILTADEIADAENTGKAWGEQEVECWKDQHDGSFEHAPAWTLGTFAGLNPHRAAEEKARAWEELVDAAARDVWDAARS